MAINRFGAFVVLACSSLFGCAQADDGRDASPLSIPEPTESAPEIDTKSDAFSLPAFAVSSLFAQTDQFPAGIAGDRDTVFVGDVFGGRVVAYSRLTRQPIGELPVPEGGFTIPLILQSLGEGRLAVMTAGGVPQPNPLVPVTPVIYEFDHHIGPQGFSASRTRTVTFPEQSVGFPEDILPLPQNRYLLSDAVLGRIWVVDSDGSTRIGIGAPPGSVQNDAPIQLRYCDTMPLIQVGGVPFLFSAATIPGVGGMAERDGTVFFSNPCAGAIFKVPVATFFDHRTPMQRASSIKPTAIKKDPSVVVEQLLTPRFNPYDDSDRYLYANDSLQLRVIRIDVSSGKRQVVGDKKGLFDFPSSINFLPPLLPLNVSPLFVVSNQQHRLTVTNSAIAADQVTSPFTITRIDIFNPF